MSAEAARAAPTRWQVGTVERIVDENYRTKTITLRLADWQPFRPGQHYRVRLTAPDGYQAQRNYSIASAPERSGVIDLTIELVPEGEASPYFHDVVRPGDEIELRGPIGGPFTWTQELGGPLLLVAGGSGVVPLMSMLGHRHAAAPDVRAVLLYSSRSLEDVIYHKELERLAAEPNLTVLHTLTRSRPPGWDGLARRIDGPMLADALNQLDSAPYAYVCGPTPLVESVADELVNLNLSPERIRTERFGPSA
jgi:ferredoxin-NADP reductase